MDATEPVKDTPVHVRLVVSLSTVVIANRTVPVVVLEHATKEVENACLVSLVSMETSVIVHVAQDAHHVIRPQNALSVRVVIMEIFVEVVALIIAWTRATSHMDIVNYAKLVFMEVFVIMVVQRTVVAMDVTNHQENVDHVTQVSMEQNVSQVVAMDVGTMFVMRGMESAHV